MDKRGGNSRIDAARQCAQHFFIAYFLFKLLNCALYVIAHGPLAACAAHIIEKVFEHFEPFLGVHHFGVELNAVKFFIGVFHSRNGTRFGGSRRLKTFGQFLYVDSMAHPARGRGFNAVEQLGLAVCYIERAPSVLARTVSYRAAERAGYQLTAVANTEHGNARRKYLRRDTRRAGFVERRRSARKNKSYRLGFGYLFGYLLIRNKLAINICFAHSARYKLIVLTAEIDDENCLLCHGVSPYVNSE